MSFLFLPARHVIHPECLTTAVLSVCSRAPYSASDTNHTNYLTGSYKPHSPFVPSYISLPSGAGFPLRYADLLFLPPETFLRTFTHSRSLPEALALLSCVIALLFCITALLFARHPPGFRRLTTKETRPKCSIGRMKEGSSRTKKRLERCEKN